MICILSETGLLQCCYLGTDPVSTSIPTIMPSTIMNVEDAEEQLAKLNKQIKQAMNDPGNIFYTSFLLSISIFISCFYLALVIKRKSNAQVIIQIVDCNQFSVSLFYANIHMSIFYCRK